MTTQPVVEDLYFRKSRFAIYLTHLLDEPFVYLLVSLPFILYKDLGATAFQVSILTMLRPVVALFSFYWSAWVAKRKDRLRSNLIGAGILARLPFLLIPFIDNIPFLIFSAAIYTFFSRAGMPAWMEILNLNLPKNERQKFFSIGVALGYAEGILIACALGWLLDSNQGIWKLFFFISALLGMLGVLIQRSVPIRGESENLVSKPTSTIVPPSFDLLKPWKDCLHLIRTRPDFARFQWGFMAGGFGLMLMKPALPLFFVGTLHLSYLELTMALFVCEGIGFVLASPLWGKAMNRFPIHYLTSAVCIGFALFPLCLFLATMHIVWLYTAYFFYGIIQSGSRLIWQLSGPLFSDKEDSSQFSGVNVVMVGIRGLIAPLLGALLCSLVNPLLICFLGMLFCLYGGWHMLHPYRTKNFGF